MSLVDLNLSGTRFTVYRDVLMKNDYFKKLLSYPEMQIKDDKGAIFIQRSPVMFDNIIAYLTLSNLSFFDSLTLKERIQFLHEANFYCLNIPDDKMTECKLILTFSFS